MARDNYTTRWKPQRLIDLAATSIGDNWHKVGWEVGTDAVENVGTTTILVAHAHSVAALDILIMYTGGEAHESLEVASVATDFFTLAEALAGAPSATEEFASFTPDVTDALSTPTTTSTTVLGMGNHGVTAKDFLMFSDGDEESEPRHAESAGADDVTVVEALSGTPSAGEKMSYKTPDVVDAAESAGGDTTINATGHAASVGDVLYFIDGGEVSEVRSVASTNTNDITLDAALTGTPSAAEEFCFWTPTSTDQADAGTTDTIITAAAHSAAVNDIFIMTSGGEIDEPRIILSIATNTFTLNEALSGTPSATETFSLTTPTGTEVIDAAISTTSLHAIDHAAAVGDFVLMIDGGETGEMRAVLSITRNDITINEILTGTPSAAEEFILLSGTPDALDASVPSTTVIPAVAHGAASGDFLMFSTGGEESEPRLLASTTTADIIVVDAALTGTPSATEVFHTLAATGTDAVESGTTDTILVATAHSVAAGFMVMMSSGGEIDEPRLVTSVTANTITLDAALSGTPSSTETFSFFGGTKVGTAVDSGTTDTIITDAAHDAIVGDLFFMSSGGEIDEPRIVITVATNTFTLNEALSGTPTAAETYQLFTATVSDAIEAGQTDVIMVAKSHGLAINDLFMMYSGGEESEVRHATAVTTDTITLDSALSGTPSAAELFTSVTSDATDVLDANESTTKIFATAHSAKVGDVIVMTSGGEDGDAQEVSSVTTDSITLGTALSGTPTASETFTILRPQVINKAKILLFDSSLNQKTLFAEASSLPTEAQFSMRASTALSLDLKTSNLHSGADNKIEPLASYYTWVKNDGTAPSSGELDITIIE